MSKREFLVGLRTALNGKVEPYIVSEHVNYYEDYINVEMRKGRSESEILQMLGDPRLIAKTILETRPGGRRENAYQTADAQETWQDSSYREEEPNPVYRNAAFQKSEYENASGRVKTFHIPGWLWTVIAVLVAVLIFSVVMSVLSFLAPVIITLLVVMFLVKLFGEWLN